MRAYTDVDLATAEVRAIESGKRKFYLPLLNGESGSINLTPGSASCDVLFGLRTDGQYEKPSFLTGGAASEEQKGREGLSMVLVPGDELKAFLEKLDAAFEAKFRENGGRGEWHPLVSPKGTLDSNGFKLKVILGGDRGLTDVKVREQKGVSGGSGGDAVKDLVAHSVWTVSGRSSLALHASFLLVDAAAGPAEAAPMEANPFPLAGSF